MFVHCDKSGLYLSWSMRFSVFTQYYQLDYYILDYSITNWSIFSQMNLIYRYIAANIDCELALSSGKKSPRLRLKGAKNSSRNYIYIVHIKIYMSKPIA